MGITNLEDMIMPKPSIKDKLDAYYETATPEQVVKEFEELGVEFKPITVEKKVLSTNIKISDELSAVINAEEEMWNDVSDSMQPSFDAEIEIGIRELMQDATSLPTYLLSDPEIVGYPNLEFQEQIYDWVKGSLPTQGYSVKDLGCGRGDFFGKLQDHLNVDYIGIELNPNLCNVGKQKYPEINILNNDYFEVDIKTDYTVCIGTLGDNLGQNKWENFNKTLNWAISNTKIAVIFILQRDCYQNPAYFDYPFKELFENIDPNVKFVLDYSEMEDIYKLTVHIDGFNY